MSRARNETHSESVLSLALESLELNRTYRDLIIRIIEEASKELDPSKKFIEPRTMQRLREHVVQTNRFMERARILGH